MTISLFDAVDNTTRTTNGAVAFKSTGSPLIDLFAKIGDARGLDITRQFEAAYLVSPEVALRTLLWARDVRGGAGERDTVRKLLKRMATGAIMPKGYEGLLRLIPEVGRWDDLLEFIGTSWEDEALHIIEAGLAVEDGLCAKWMPRQGPIANKIRARLDLTPKQYRKLLVGLTKVVETQMCAKNWSDINYQQVPSKAMNVYAKAFARNDGARFEKFKTAVENGEAKINAGAVFPYDVVHLLKKDARLAEVQWKALPDYLEGSDQRLLAVVDVSGSMECKPGDGGYANGGVTCMDVAISLGIYLSERLTGTFKDSFITFTDRPKLIRTTGSLANRVRAAKDDVGYNTNLMGVFDCVLNAAVLNKVSEDQMPTQIVILSDTQFDGQIRDFNKSTTDRIRAKYAQAGYNMPHIVYWNIGAAKYGNSPITMHETGASMVSGFSPAIVKTILAGNLDPLQTVLTTVGADRYNYLAA